MSSHSQSTTQILEGKIHKEKCKNKAYHWKARALRMKKKKKENKFNHAKYLKITEINYCIDRLPIHFHIEISHGFM